MIGITITIPGGRKLFTLYSLPLCLASVSRPRGIVCSILSRLDRTLKYPGMPGPAMLWPLVTRTQIPPMSVTSPHMTLSQSAKFIIHSANKDRWENLRGWNNYNPSPEFEFIIIAWWFSNLKSRTLGRSPLSSAGQWAGWGEEDTPSWSHLCSLALQWKQFCKNYRAGIVKL